MKAHIDTERYLKASGLAFTILRNSAYAEGWNLYLGESGEAGRPGRRADFMGVESGPG